MFGKIVDVNEILSEAQRNLKKMGVIEIITQTTYREKKISTLMPSFNTLSLICYKEGDKFGVAKSNNEKVEKISLEEFRAIANNSKIFNQDFYRIALEACREIQKPKI